MRGYEVVTSDGRTIGHVHDVRERCVVVESGKLRRARRVVPMEFAHVDDREGRVAVTVPGAVLRDAPQVDGEGRFDREEVARHYGLAGSMGGEPRGTEDTPEHRRAEAHEHASAETGDGEDARRTPLTRHREGEIERRPEQLYEPRGR